MIEIRPAPDIRSFLRPISVAFGDEPGEENAERLGHLLPLERTHSAFDDGALVGSAGAFDFQLTVPGGLVQAAGVTVVGVLPTHRRRGILTQLMRAQLDDARARGDLVAYLWASEERIYGRFGYGLASLGMSIDLEPARAAFRDDPGRSGAVRLLDEEEAAAEIPPIYDRARADWPGMFSRSEAWWRTRRLRAPLHAPTTLFRAVWEDGAYALYRLKMDFTSGPAGEVEVVECVGTTLESTREMWRYLLDLDIVTRVRADRLPVDHPLLLLLDQPRRLNPVLYDALWARLIEVGGALEARARGEGAVVLELTDAFLPDNAGRWRVAGDGVGRTDEAAELALDVADLGSAYLGGFTFAELARGGRVRELVPGALARANAILGWDRKPWCPEIF